MQLSKTLIAKFQQSHFEEFGYAISAATAESELLSLAELIEITGRTQCPINETKTSGENDGTRTEL